MPKNKNSSIYLSLIVPAYNEEKIIKSSLEKIIKYLKSRGYTWEILVVDDGSVDNTVKIAETFSKKGVRVVRLSRNFGKGKALREGVMKSIGEYVVYSDCDLSVPIEAIDSVLIKLEKGIGVVIGSRRVPGAHIMVHQPFLREAMGRVFTLLTQIILQMKLVDFTCGFKGFSKKAAKKVFSKGKVNRWAYDSEILFLAKLNKYKIAEVPVSWFNRKDSRVNLRHVVWESFIDLLKIRKNQFVGEYK